MDRLENVNVSVEKLLDSVEEGADMQYSNTKTRVWRGGVQVSEDAFEDAQPFERVEGHKREVTDALSSRNTRAGVGRQVVGNVELKDLEAGLPSMREHEGSEQLKGKRGS